MLTTIYLTGELGHKFGRKWRLAVSSPAEAVRAIEANRPGLVAYLAESGDRGVGFKVKVDGDVIDEDKLQFQRRGATIRISPVVSGSKDKTVSIVLGIVLVVASYGAAAGWFGGVAAAGGVSGSGIAGFAGSSAFGVAGGVSWAGFVGAMGISMALGGVSQMLASQPGVQSDVDAGRPSYLFNGPVNSAHQGGCVPLCYGGPILIG